MREAVPRKYNMEHNLGHDFEVHGIVVVVWGGTRDVGRNETEKGLHQIKKLVENHKQSNVIVMCVPCRFDFEPKSCVNDEVKVYNRKLKSI